MSYDQELAAGLQAVRLAAKVCQAVQAAITTDSLEKKDKSPVTVADFASQALICRHLMSVFPEDPVIGEEGAADLKEESGAEFLNRIVEECGKVGIDASGQEVCEWIDRGDLQEQRPRFWTLDPIDGTKGFLRKEQYAISLALIVDGQIKVGILGCPNMPVDFKDESAGTGVLAWAVRGEGSFCQSIHSDASDVRPLKVSSTPSTSEARFCESVESGHSSHGWSGQIAESLGITREPFRIDSQCKYLAVAMGEADIYLRLPTRKGYVEKIWDHAGGVLVVEEAGGTVTDIHGTPPQFVHGATLQDNEGMVVTNGQFHDRVVASVKENAPQ